MTEHPMIGGKSDGQMYVHHNGKVPATIDRDGEQYIGLEFSPNNDSNRIVIYMCAGMAPIDALAIWTKRKYAEKEEKALIGAGHFEINGDDDRFLVFVQDLIDATDEQILGEGVDNFIEYCVKAQETLRAERKYHKKMRLTVALGIKIADLREKPPKRLLVLHDEAKGVKFSGGGGTAVRSLSVSTPPPSPATPIVHGLPAEPVIDPDDAEW